MSTQLPNLTEEKPAPIPLPEIVLSLIKSQEPKVRKILIDLVYSLYSLIPDSMEQYSLSFWNLLKETKTDKNKFVREASLACLKKFGKILKESPDVKQFLAKGKKADMPHLKKRGNIRKGPKNKSFFKKEGPKSKRDKGGKPEGGQKRRVKTQMKKHSSKELVVKGGPRVGSERGPRQIKRRSQSPGKNDSRLRGKIINKRMNLKNVKGRLDLKKIKKEFAKKSLLKPKDKNKLDNSIEIEIAFKEPEKKIDYEKWYNQPDNEPSTIQFRESSGKGNANIPKEAPSFGEAQPEHNDDQQSAGVFVALPRRPRPNIPKDEAGPIEEETIPQQFSDEEEMMDKVKDNLQFERHDSPSQREIKMKRQPSEKMNNLPMRRSNQNQRFRAREGLAMGGLENKRTVSPRQPRNPNMQSTGSFLQQKHGVNSMRVGTGENDFGGNRTSWNRGVSDFRMNGKYLVLYIVLISIRAIY